jgi:hypothetical protein
MPQLFDITEWDELSWFSTGGTRAKRYLQSPDGVKYYFKQSYKKEVIDYKYEFWSEIIASEVGKVLGFNMLQYDLAVDNDIMGCISQSMIESDEQELNEGGKYLQAYDNTFEPDDKKTRNQYSFQLIQNAFEAFDLEQYMDNMIEVIIFDALIGNSDRHQENWAFITTHGRMSHLMSKLEQEVKDPFFKNIPGWVKRVLSFNKVVDEEKESLTDTGRLIRLYFQNVESFSPIYDSGSSLGRELSMEKVEQMLKDHVQLEAYLRRGTSEIHWEGKKVNHFDLIQNLQNTSYMELTNKCIGRVLECFDGIKIAEIVNGIDKLVPESLSHYKLPDTRKQLIIKMITLRSQKMSALIHEGI